MEISGGGGGILLISSSENSDPQTLLVVLVVFLRLPFGAGSRFGVVRLYVTVLVTTLLTLTDLLQALRGVAIVSNILLEGFDQSAGEKGEYRADVTPDMAVLGDGPVPGEKIGECCCGILSRLSDALLCWLGALRGVGGGYEQLGDLKSAVLLPEKLLAVEVDGTEAELSFDTFESSDSVRFSAVGGGLASIGVRAFRKSVYAVGGVIGVRRSCSCLITADKHAEIGVEHISEGNDAD